MAGRSFISHFKLIFKILVFILIVFAITKYEGEKYVEATKENKINAFTQARFEEFYALEKNSLDMVYIGSSHSYCTFDPEIIDGALKTKSWQMGTPSQHADTSYYLLREILNYQTPKVVVMELYWDVLDDDFEPKQAESFFEVLKNEELKEEYIKKVYPISEKVKESIPVIKNQQSYFAYKTNEIEMAIEEEYAIAKPWVAPVEGVEYYRSLGYVYCDIIIPEEEFHKTNQFRTLDGEKWEFSSKQLSYLEEIVKLCEAKNIELVFVTAPVANVSMEFIENYEGINQKVSHFATENNIPYIDYNIVNLEQKLLENNNFRDDAHLNHSGVEIICNNFISFLQEEVELN